MSDIAETVSEAIEKGPESRLNSWVAVLVALAATFMALCNVKDGNIVQAMAQDQAKAVDAWSYYQAKSTKQNLAEALLDQLTVQKALAAAAAPAEARALLDEKIGAYASAAKRYGTEKEEVKKTAEGYQTDYDRLNVHDDQFDMAEAFLSISIALFGITALTQKRAMLVVAIVFAALGALFGLAGFLALNLHPDFIARILG
jgi:hypothetical protein